MLKVNYSESSMKRGLGRLSDKMGVLLLMYCGTKAKEMESYMKSNRPWTDRTNQAKATLNVRVSQPNREIIRTTLAHGVNYGIWLELAHEKQYAIVAPTVRRYGPLMMSDLKDIMNKIKL